MHAVTSVGADHGKAYSVAAKQVSENKTLLDSDMPAAEVGYQDNAAVCALGQSYFPS